MHTATACSLQTRWSNCLSAVLSRSVPATNRPRTQRMIQMCLLYFLYRYRSAVASWWSPTPRRAMRGNTSALEPTWLERGRARSRNSPCSVNACTSVFAFHWQHSTLHLCRSNYPVSLKWVGRAQCDFFFYLSGGFNAWLIALIIRPHGMPGLERQSTNHTSNVSALPSATLQ